MSKDIRCAICGAPIQGDCVRITRGSVDDKFKVDSLWGFAHHSCFARAFPSKKAVLDELRSQLSPKSGAA